MYDYKDISGLTRLTVGALWAYMVFKFLFGLAGLFKYAVLEQPAPPGLSVLVGLLAAGDLIAVIAAAILVCFWIYRANANAHTMSGGLSVTPGWAVGWFFIPVASLFKPYLAMKETWLASHYGDDWGRGEASRLLPWWWGFWLGNAAFGYIVLITRSGPLDVSAEVQFAASLLSVALTLVLIRIITQIRNAQRVTRHAEVFA